MQKEKGAKRTKQYTDKGKEDREDYNRFTTEISDIL
jgi:hypothetical protein